MTDHYPELFCGGCGEAWPCDGGEAVEGAVHMAMVAGGWSKGMIGAAMDAAGLRAAREQDE